MLHAQISEFENLVCSEWAYWEPLFETKILC